MLLQRGGQAGPDARDTLKRARGHAPTPSTFSPLSLITHARVLPHIAPQPPRRLPRLLLAWHAHLMVDLDSLGEELAPFRAPLQSRDQQRAKRHRYAGIVRRVLDILKHI